MIEHVSLQAADFNKMKKFYTAALEPLGYALTMDFDGASGFKEGGHTSFWLMKGKKTKMHVAFRAKSKRVVRQFYDAARKAGAKDNGPPGPRKDYSPDYYAAFVLDPEGNNIEAVYFDHTAKIRRRK